MVLISKLLSTGPVGDVTRKISQINHKDGSDITLAEVKDLLNKMKGTAKNKHAKFVVTGLAIDKWVQIKAYNSDHLNEENFDDYLDDRVKSSAKFKKFAQLRVYTYA